MPTPPEDAPIEIDACDAAWPERFRQEKTALAPLLAPWLAGEIEHIGSTAVPGLAAKPVIDILAPVTSLAGARGAIDAVKPLGYLHFPYQADTMHWFCKPSPLARTHHLHLVPLGSRVWAERLAFRDALRRRPDLARQYEAMKRRLAAEFRHDRDGYTAAKGPFIGAVVAAQGLATPLGGLPTQTHQGAAREPPDGPGAPHPGDVRVGIEDPAQADVLALIAELDAYQDTLYPPEARYALDLASLRQPHVAFAVAREARGQAVGCGAMVVTQNQGELKRMYVRPSHRGRGIAQRLLDTLEHAALTNGCGALFLETGPRQPEALAFYARQGFARTGPFGTYPDHPLSVFMVKILVHPRSVP